MSRAEFLELIADVVGVIGEDDLDEALERKLNDNFPADGVVFRRLKELCAEGARDGWLMEREAGGISFGRAVRPGAEAGRFSVDVVRMQDVVGPHHIHTTGEIGAVMALEGTPRFDRWGEGWYVYPPGSAHHPTVSGGAAYVLYLLPDGAIEFTGK